MQKSNFKFKSPKLICLDFKVNKKYQADEMLALNIIDEVSIETLNDTTALVTLTLKVFKEEDFNEVPFFINVEMQGQFSWSMDIDASIVKKLLNQNAPAVLLSYIRPYVTTLTTGAGYPPLVLPLMNFVEN